MKPRIEYVYKCGCQRPDAVYKYNKTGSGTSTRPTCPDHGAFIDHKIGWCVDCGKQVKLSVRHNNFKRCKECRALRKKQRPNGEKRKPRPLKVHQEPVVVEPVRLVYNPFVAGSIPWQYLTGQAEADPVFGVAHV